MVWSMEKESLNSLLDFFVREALRIKSNSDQKGRFALPIHQVKSNFVRLKDGGFFRSSL